MIAPYTDTTLWPTFDLTSAKYVKDFSLGFIIADKDEEPSWGGYYKVSSDFYSDIITKVRAKNGKLICSFGGASGAELATKLNSVDEIFAAYDYVISKYDFKFVDFDIEGQALYNQKANKRRAEAIKKLKSKYKDLHVSLTVAVMPFGLDKDAMNLIKQTPHDLVNLMTMNFGNEKKMGQAVIEAIESAKKQVKADIGVTVMIGKNDTPEIFTLNDAKLVKEYTKSKNWIKRLSFWAIERDSGRSGDLAHSSKIEQKPWAFSKIFALY
jgi:hypothetical protein